jgi:hypothetical protein
VAAAAFVFLAGETAAQAQQFYYVRPPPERGLGLNLGVDLEGAADVTPPQGTDVEGGGGVKLRIGAEFRRPFLRIIPEIGFAYTHLFVTDTYGDNIGWNMERLFVGARVGFGEVVVPMIYGHIGYGWRGTDQNNGAYYVPAANGLAADGGVALDFHLVRHFGFGIHLEYVTVQAAPSIPDWVAAGVHGDYRF